MLCSLSLLLYLFKFTGYFLVFSSQHLPALSAALYAKVFLLLTTEGASTIYRMMMLPLFDYSDVTWHNSGKGNIKI